MAQVPRNTDFSIVDFAPYCGSGFFSLPKTQLEIWGLRNLGGDVALV